MGAISAGRPAIQVVAGPMLTRPPPRREAGRLHRLPAILGAVFAAGEIDEDEIEGGGGAPRHHRREPAAVMGTASTHGGHRGNPRDDAAGNRRHSGRARRPPARRGGLWRHGGRRAGARKGLTRRIASSRLQERSRTPCACSWRSAAPPTPCIHLDGDRRAGRESTWTSGGLNQLSDATPVLVDLKPTGEHYMEDLFAAGGIGAVLRELRPHLRGDCLTVTGETLAERLAEPAAWVDRRIIRPLDDPLQQHGGLVALFGSLAPRGAIFKRSAADPALFEREGRAVVFTSPEDLAARIDDPDLDVHPHDVLVLQNAGPASPSAMPEAGCLPIPAKLARAGVRDMLRVSDARMSGTAFGSVVLRHIRGRHR